MTIESQIAGLVTAANNLTDAVNGKLVAIDQKVKVATESVPATVAAQLYKEVFVDADLGKDTNPGTLAQPFKTMRAAILGNQQIQLLNTHLMRGQTHTDVDDGVIISSQFNIQFTPYGSATASPVIDISKKALPNGSAWLTAQKIKVWNTIKLRTGADGFLMPLFCADINLRISEIELRAGPLITTFEGDRHISVKLHMPTITCPGAGFIVTGFNSYNGSFSFIPWAANITGDTLVNRIGPIIRHAASNAPMNVLSNMSI